RDNVITVSDQGCGIPKEEIERVTEAFYMVDKARSRKAGGCGLGLSLCSMIAQLHHARLSIESEIGKGTKVSVIFQEK
ncbi:MAG: cell wall metabolism sensor histidine kinase WalK, partial [Lachnospiraceae bacterium]|nr:cell wall metabolism sensor histidine kinase WalK [Lachnospiraceae bacterium]